MNHVKAFIVVAFVGGDVIGLISLFWLAAKTALGG